MPATHKQPTPAPDDLPRQIACDALRAAGFALWSFDPAARRLTLHDFASPAPLVITSDDAADLILGAAPGPFCTELTIDGPQGPRTLRLSGGVTQNDERGDAVLLSGIAEDITGSIRAAQIDRDARIRAEAADRAKTEFLASMSHEIRTPMTSILGYAELLAEPGHPEERRAAFIDSIRRNGRHLLVIINDVLDISRIEADRLHVEAEPIDPASLVVDVCATLEPRARDKGIGFSCVLCTPVPGTLTTDPTRLRQILINLVGNAIKFTDHGQVRVELSSVRAVGGNHALVIDVIDTGQGIPPCAAGRLFQPYAQADASIARTHGGSGLGLVISRRLARLLGGDVVLLRSSPGSGSTFRMTIAAEAAGDERSTDDLPSPQRLPEPSSGKTPAGICGKVLLAEDGPDNQRLLSLLLRRAGVDVEIAEHGQAALDCVNAAVARGEPYDLILMDMQMPVMDGFEATRRLRREGWRGPIIALTAHALRRDRDACLEAGCDDFAPKPIEARVLLELVGRWLDEGRRRAQLAA